MMNRKAEELGPARHPLRPPGRPGRGRPLLVGARSLQARPGRDAQAALPPARDDQDDHDPGRTLATQLERPPLHLSGHHRREDGAYEQRGVERGRGGPTQGPDDLRRAARQSSRGQRNADLARLLDWGFDQYRSRSAIRGGASTQRHLSRSPTVGCSSWPRAPVSLVQRRPSLVERVVAPAMVELPVGRARSSARCRSRPREAHRDRAALAAETIEAAGLGARLAGTLAVRSTTPATC